MKIFFLTITFLSFTYFSFAQDVKKNDSLLKVLATAKHDTAKVWAMQDLSYNYLYSNPEKSAWYAQKALTLAKKINDESSVISCMIDIGIALSVTGSHTVSLQILLSALEKSEKLKDEKLISETFICLAEVYKSLGDYKKSISYSLRSLAIDVAAKDTDGILLNYLNLGIYYEKSKRLDSALIYTNKAYLLVQKINDTETLGDIMLSLGDIYSGLGKDEIALPYYRKAILANQFVGNYVLLGNSYYAMAKLFKRTGYPDSVSVYIKKSYETSLKVSDKSGMFDSATLLAAFYEKRNSDSSLKYLKLSMVLKDSLFDQEKVKHLQSLTINEQLRQSKIEEEKKLAAKESNKNLQMAGIGGFIPLFFGVSLLFSKKRVNRKIIDTLGLLILLFFFQFISLIIDQYLDPLYNYSTVLKFSLKVGTAVLLIPVKKMSERLVNEKIVRTTKVSD
jgi:two-component system NtrC family sensor kinase